MRDEHYLYRANVLGTQALLKVMTAAGVRQLVYASCDVPRGLLAMGLRLYVMHSSCCSVREFKAERMWPTRGPSPGG